MQNFSCLFKGERDYCICTDSKHLKKNKYYLPLISILQACCCLCIAYIHQYLTTSHAYGIRHNEVQIVNVLEFYIHTVVVSIHSITCKHWSVINRSARHAMYSSLWSRLLYYGIQFVLGVKQSLNISSHFIEQMSLQRITLSKLSYRISLAIQCNTINNFIYKIVALLQLKINSDNKLLLAFIEKDLDLDQC